MRYVSWKGQVVERARVMLPAMSPSTQFGLSVFEGIRGYVQRSGQLSLFRFQDHVCRLRDSAESLSIEHGVTTEGLLDAIRELIQANKVDSDFAIRVILLFDLEGSWQTEASPGVLIAPVVKERLPLRTLEPQKVMVVNWERPSKKSMPPSIKVGANYINSRLGYIEARRNGCDVPLFLNRDGFLSESSGANIGLFVGGSLVTPMLDQDILAGITRDTLIHLHRSSGGCVVEKRVTTEDLTCASEIFLCGTAAEVQPVGMERTTSFGPLTLSLAQEYRKCVTGESCFAREDWFTDAAG